MGAEPSDWEARGRAAVEGWDEWLGRAAGIRDDRLREEVIAWVGRSDVPGSPAERYQKVVDDLRSPSADPERAETRVKQLENQVDLLKSRVLKAELSQVGDAVAVGGRLTSQGWALVVVAALGLVAAVLSDPKR
jgi:hypothetical protein